MLGGPPWLASLGSVGHLRLFNHVQLRLASAPFRATLSQPCPAFAAILPADYLSNTCLFASQPTNTLQAFFYQKLRREQRERHRHLEAPAPPPSMDLLLWKQPRLPLQTPDKACCCLLRLRQQGLRRGVTWGRGRPLLGAFRFPWALLLPSQALAVAAQQVQGQVWVALELWAPCAPHPLQPFAWRSSWGCTISRPRLTPAAAAA